MGTYNTTEGIFSLTCFCEMSSASSHVKYTSWFWHYHHKQDHSKHSAFYLFMASSRNNIGTRWWKTELIQNISKDESFLSEPNDKYGTLADLEFFEKTKHLGIQCSLLGPTNKMELKNTQDIWEFKGNFGNFKQTLNYFRHKNHYAFFPHTVQVIHPVLIIEELSTLDCVFCSLTIFSSTLTESNVLECIVCHLRPWWLSQAHSNIYVIHEYVKPGWG